MEYYKKFGMIVMTVSVFLVILFISMSNQLFGNLCNSSAYTFLTRCLYLGTQDTFPYKLPLKYAVVFCVAIFGVGFLWYKGVLKVPAKNKIKDLLD